MADLDIDTIEFPRKPTLKEKLNNVANSEGAKVAKDIYNYLGRISVAAYEGKKKEAKPPTQETPLRMPQEKPPGMEIKPGAYECVKIKPYIEME